MGTVVKIELTEQEAKAVAEALRHVIHDVFDKGREPGAKPLEKAVREITKQIGGGHGL